MRIATFNVEAEVRRQYNRRVLFCIRVREAALLIGLWDLFIHAIGLCTLIYFFQNNTTNTQNMMGPDWRTINRVPLLGGPQFRTEKSTSDLLKNQQFISSSILLDRILEKRNLSRIPQEFNARYYHSNADLMKMKWSSSFRKQEQCIIFFIILSSVVLIFAHLFGILLNKPPYMIPYFLIKIFNVVLSILSLLGFYAYLPDIKLWLLVQPDFPLRQNLLELNSQTLRFIVFVALLFIILAKMYMAAIIWYCYRYVITLNMARAIGIRQEVSTHTGYFVDQMYSPPKYEEAIHLRSNQNEGDAPPPYTPLLHESS